MEKKNIGLQSIDKFKEKQDEICIIFSLFCLFSPNWLFK